MVNMPKLLKKQARWISINIQEFLWARERWRIQKTRSDGDKLLLPKFVVQKLVSFGIYYKIFMITDFFVEQPMMRRLTLI